MSHRIRLAKDLQFVIQTFSIRSITELRFTPDYLETELLQNLGHLPSFVPCSGKSPLFGWNSKERAIFVAIMKADFRFNHCRMRDAASRKEYGDWPTQTDQAPSE